MSYGGIKEYHIIHLDFTKNVCHVFNYLRDRRLTARSAWNYIKEEKPDLKFNMNNHDDVGFYDKVINDMNYDYKRCDRYMTFNVN